MAEGDEDPRAELVRRLLEYERMKQAAREIDALPLADRDFATVRVWFDRVAAARLPDVRPEDLRAAWATLIARARINRHHLVTREQLSVRAAMSRLLKALEPSRFAEFTSLFPEHADIAHLVVTFLALLELAREQLVADRAGWAVCADLRAADGRPWASRSPPSRARNDPHAGRASRPILELKPHSHDPDERIARDQDHRRSRAAHGR